MFVAWKNNKSRLEEEEEKEDGKPHERMKMQEEKETEKSCSNNVSTL